MEARYAGTEIDDAHVGVGPCAGEMSGIGLGAAGG